MVVHLKAQADVEVVRWDSVLPIFPVLVLFAVERACCSLDVLLALDEVAKVLDLVEVEVVHDKRPAGLRCRDMDFLELVEELVTTHTQRVQGDGSFEGLVVCLDFIPLAAGFGHASAKDDALFCGCDEVVDQVPQLPGESLQGRFRRVLIGNVGLVDTGGACVRRGGAVTGVA